MKKYLECGKIANTHGVRGGLIAESWCNTPEVLAGLKTVYTEKGGAYTPLRVLHAAPYKGRVLAELEGIDTLEAAVLLKDTVLFAAREDIPHGAEDYFIQDLIGLPVIDFENGSVYGTVSDMLSSGASDLYEVKTENGKFLIPAVPEFIKRVDTEKGIFIKAIEGLFE